MRVAILAYDDARLFDLAVAREVWRADRLPIEVATCAPGHGTVRVGGLPVSGTRTLAWARDADLVVVPGSDRPQDFVHPDRSVAAVPRAVREAHDEGAVVASLCSGAFVLAAAGLLDGRRATTHWSLADALDRAFPDVVVEPESLFVREDRVWTSAGTAAGIDLSLALVREYLGPREATETSRRLVAAPFRRGDQAQFVDRPLPSEAGTDPLAGAVARLVDREGMTWTVAGLARALHLSERTLARRFRQETGTTVHAWLTTLRIDEARRLLAGSDLAVGAVARRCGYGSEVTFRQRFRAEVGLSPAGYRAANRG